jgi:hypothetical protein
MESQTSLQREVQRAKQEAREAIEARDIHAEEMSDLSETVEMATLDKEMAEEKVRTSNCVSLLLFQLFYCEWPPKIYVCFNRGYLLTSSKLNQCVV